MNSEQFRDITRGFLLGEGSYGEYNPGPDRNLGILREAYSQWDPAGAIEAVNPAETGGYIIDLPHPKLVDQLKVSGWSVNKIPGGVHVEVPLR
jgi:hypothetical protein